MTLVGMGVGAPSEGRFLALKPLSPAEAWIRVPGHPDPPVSSLLTWCKASPWNVGVGWGVAAGWGGGGVHQALKIIPNPGQQLQRSFVGSHAHWPHASAFFSAPWSQSSHHSYLLGFLELGVGIPPPSPPLKGLSSFLGLVNKK